MAVTDWKYPTTEGFDINLEAGLWSGWTNPNNVQADDGSFATTYQDGISNNQKNTWGDFDFGIPTGNTIAGIEFEIKGKVDSGTEFLLFKSGHIRTSGLGGDLNVAPQLTTTNTVYSYGSPTTGYGLTGADMANGKFYVVAYPFQSIGGKTLSLDYIKVRVYHSAPSGFIPFFI
jgi:hypothetical protein